MAGRASREVVCSTCELHAEATFRVEGMDCHEEVVILERRLKPLAGMEAISADVMGQRLHVKYDAARLTTSAMVDAVGETGMRIWLEHEQPREPDTAVTSRLRLVAISAVGMGAGVACAQLGAPRAAAVFGVLAALIGGVFPAQRAVKALRTRTVDINVLMVIAVCGALLLRDWLEAAAVVLLFAIAQWLEVRTLERARSAIRTLMDLSPKSATVRRAGIERQLLVHDILVGDEVIVRPGEKLPVDGQVTIGHSAVNEAPITGESLPIDKAPGDEVYAGTINGRGALEIRVGRVGRDTRVARIIHLVEVAQAERAPVQSFIDRFARVYTPAVIVLALAVAIVPPLSLAQPFAVWAYRALVLLVIACPCALVISTPVSIVAALSAAARNGVLIKGGAHLERLAAVRVVAFDKTGTLTHGVLNVTDIVPAAGVLAPDLLRHAAAVEWRSEHPIGRAIAAHARRQGMEVPSVTGFTSITGMGAQGLVSGRPVYTGTRRLLETVGIPTPLDADIERRLRRDGKSLVFVALDGVYLGTIALADLARGTARESIELLRAQGVDRVVMLTGDHPETASAIAGAVGVDEYHADLLPEQKHALIGTLSATTHADSTRHHAVMMVGDGINDAPALAAADIGVAMGAAGSDVALETADIALMSDELLKLPYALRLAKATLRNIKTNVAVSIVLKGAFLVLAITGTATLWMAVLADTGASVIVVANALRLLRAR